MIHREQMCSIRRGTCMIAVFFLTMGIVGNFPRSSAYAAGETVKGWITTTTDSWVARGLDTLPAAKFVPYAADGTLEIKIDEKTKYQKWEGAGAAFTDGAAYLINQIVKPELRDSVMTKLFDPVKGVGVSFLRNPIGSSDLTMETRRYTNDDNPADKNDPTLPNFNMNVEKVDVLPLTKLARKLNPELTLLINAWSPPAWMKDNNNLVAGGILPACYQHHVNYHVKTIAAYEAEGIHPNYVTLNNEPTCCNGINYPSVWNMGASAMQTMLKNFWLPTFSREKLTTKILLLDFNNGNFSGLVAPFLNDTAIKKSPYIGGVAFHGYWGGPSPEQNTAHDQYGYDVFFTEFAGSGDGRGQQETDMRKMVAVIRNWGKSYVKWPVAADENQGPHNGGCGSCRGLVRVWRFDAAKKGTVDYRIDYYVVGHLTKFVRNGAYRISSTDNSQILNVAFQNPDGTLALMLFNDGTADKIIKVVWGSEAFNYTIPTKATITFKWGVPVVGVAGKGLPVVPIRTNISFQRTGTGYAIQFPVAGSYAVELFDVRGRMVLQKLVNGARVQLYSKDYAKGLYYVRVQGKEGAYLRNIVL
jgi:glucosylceramidase